MTIVISILTINNIVIVETKFKIIKINSFTISHMDQTQTFFKDLIDGSKPIGDRYFCVFQLKNIGTEQAIKYLIEAYSYCGTSILLKHQLLYALGQLPEEKYSIVKEFLIEKMNDENENNLSRHEAAEALANYFDKEILKYYESHLDSKCNELRWTCMIALEKIKQNELKKQYGLDYNRTMEPAAPFSQDEFNNLLKEKELENEFKEKSYVGVLCSQKLSLFEKYRVMYYMRNKKDKQCIKALCQLISKQYFKTQTSLLKHEICFILGQIGIDQFENLVRECIQNEDEEDIVRHQALAAVASQSKDPIYLQQFVDPKYCQLIRESAEVAIYSIKYWQDF